MHICVTFLITLAALTLSTAAWAGQPSEPETPAVQYRPVTEVEFKAERVEGGVENPDGVTETARVAPRLPSLINVRQDFQRELLQTAEEI